MASVEIVTTAGTGSSEGWSTMESPYFGGWSWHAWIDGDARRGVASTDGYAQAQARGALEALREDRRRRTLRSV